MKTLLSKLLVAHLLVLLIAFALLVLLLQQFLNHDFMKQLMGRQLLERGDALAQQITPYLAKHDTERLTQALEIAKVSMGAEVCLVDKTKRVLAHAKPPAGRKDVPEITTCCPDLSLHGGPLKTQLASSTVCGRAMLVASVPISLKPPARGNNPDPRAVNDVQSREKPAGPDAVLLLRLPITTIDTAFNRLWLVIVLCVIVGALLAFATALLVSDRIVGPLRGMQRMAAAMAQGNFAARMSIRSRDEVAQLADSFNSLAGQLHDSLVKLEDEGAKLRGVLASMAEGVLAIGAEGRILISNQQTFDILSIPQSSLVGKQIAAAGLPENVVAAFCSCLQDRKDRHEEFSRPDMKCTLQPDGSTVCEEQHATRMGELRIAAIDILPMHLGHDEWGAVGVLRDITGVRRMEEMRRRFFSDISHELRTPLTNITGYAAALEDGTAADPATQTRALSVIIKESERLRRFIEDLLDLSRLESGAPNLQREWCDVADIATASVESLGYQAQSAQVTLHAEIPRDLPRVFADPDRLSQVLVNLIANAIHFNHPGGNVTVSASVAASELRMMVKDTGVGIVAEEVPFVWQRFYRATMVPNANNTLNENSTSATPLSNGSGLGLAIVRSIVHAHGGRVWVESVPGEGSTFGFALPIE
jgi:two-component system, OmpR family, phosphate regulon sensor histidine kinase PhoR